MKKTHFTQLKPHMTEEEILQNLLKALLRNGFKINGIPKKYQHYKKEAINGENYLEGTFGGRQSVQQRVRNIVTKT